MDSVLARMTPIERIQRFWKAHARSHGHLTVLHALSNNPTLDWTPEALCVWYGIRVDRAREVLEEFEGCGIAERVGVDDDRVRWNRKLDWAVPPSRRLARKLWGRSTPAGG